MESETTIVLVLPGWRRIGGFRGRHGQMNRSAEGAGPDPYAPFGAFGSHVCCGTFVSTCLLHCPHSQPIAATETVEASSGVQVLQDQESPDCGHFKSRIGIYTHDTLH